jgi:hypothetical protein
MRIWSLHPQYLDPQGLVALWRETLLAQKVLRGETRGYRSHPQLFRFRAQSQPVTAIGVYLHAVHAEAVRRGYSFDETKIIRCAAHSEIHVTAGQVEYEWKHLLAKLSVRNPSLHDKFRVVSSPIVHPLFRVVPGGIESWERV